MGTFYEKKVSGGRKAAPRCRLEPEPLDLITMAPGKRTENTQDKHTQSKTEAHQ